LAELAEEHVFSNIVSWFRRE